MFFYFALSSVSNLDELAQQKISKIKTRRKKNNIISGQDYQLKDNNTYYCSIKENMPQSLNHDIYNCTRKQ